jgi:hypothetical protein
MLKSDRNTALSPGARGGVPAKHVQCAAGGRSAAPAGRPAASPSGGGSRGRPRRGRTDPRPRRCAGRARRRERHLRELVPATASERPHRRRAPPRWRQRQLRGSGLDAGPRRTGRRRRGCLRASTKATSTATWRVVALARRSMRRTLPVNSLVRSRGRGSCTAWPAFTAADVVGRDQALEAHARGSMTLSSSLPTCAVSPAETLRSLTTPSKGARTSVRCSCWRAVTTRARAASSSLCALLRRISASSTWGRGHALEPAASSAARTGARPARGLGGGALAASSAEVRLRGSRGVQADEQVAGAHRRRRSP